MRSFHHEWPEKLIDHVEWIFHLWWHHRQGNRRAPPMFVQEKDSYATLNFSRTLADCFLFKKKRQWCNFSIALLRRQQHKYKHGDEWERWRNINRQTKETACAAMPFLWQTLPLKRPRAKKGKTKQGLQRWKYGDVSVPNRLAVDVVIMFNCLSCRWCRKGIIVPS